MQKYIVQAGYSPLEIDFHPFRAARFLHVTSVNSVWIILLRICAKVWAKIKLIICNLWMIHTCSFISSGLFRIGMNSYVNNTSPHTVLFVICGLVEMSSSKCLCFEHRTVKVKCNISVRIMSIRKNTSWIFNNIPELGELIPRLATLNEHPLSKNKYFAIDIFIQCID